MALSKNIDLRNGVITNYHRIVSVNIITNQQNVIEIASYTSQSKRNEEQTAIANGLEMDVFIHTRFENAAYDQTMTVETAYEWVKANVSDFNDAEDVLENSDTSAI